jgi:hypothetical protein
MSPLALMWFLILEATTSTSLSDIFSGVLPVARVVMILRRSIGARIFPLRVGRPPAEMRGPRRDHAQDRDDRNGQSSESSCVNEVSH